MLTVSAGMSVPKEQWEAMIKEHDDKIHAIGEKYLAILQEKNVSFWLFHKRQMNKKCSQKIRLQDFFSMF